MIVAVAPIVLLTNNVIIIIVAECRLRVYSALYTLTLIAFQILMRRTTAHSPLHCPPQTHPKMVAFLSHKMSVNKYIPTANSYNKIPNAYQSTALPCPKFTTISGAKYSGVPQKVCASSLSGPKSLLSPTSVKQICHSHFGHKNHMAITPQLLDLHYMDYSV